MESFEDLSKNITNDINNNNEDSDSKNKLFKFFEEKYKVLINI